MAGLRFIQTENSQPDSFLSAPHLHLFLCGIKHTIRVCCCHPHCITQFRVCHYHPHCITQFRVCHYHPHCITQFRVCHYHPIALPSLGCVTATLTLPQVALQSHLQPQICSCVFSLFKSTLLANKSLTGSYKFVTYFKSYRYFSHKHKLHLFEKRLYAIACWSKSSKFI